MYLWETKFVTSEIVCQSYVVLSLGMDTFKKNYERVWKLKQTRIVLSCWGK